MSAGARRPAAPRDAGTRRLTLRLMKALAGSQAMVTLDGDVACVAVSPRAGGAARRIDLPLALYRRVLADGLIQVDADARVTVSGEGRAWLRRALSQGDGFAEQHRETVAGTVEDDSGGRMAVTVDLAESPLAWLASRRRADGRSWISPPQLAAGERLRADYTRGRLMARVTAGWGDNVHHDRKRSGASGGLADLTDAALDARERVHRALAAVGPELSGVLVDVCCELQGLEALERRHAWPARSGKLVLALALSGLARHYGLTREARGPERAPIRHWGEEDYRPRTDAGRGRQGDRDQ